MLAVNPSTPSRLNTLDPIALRSADFRDARSECHDRESNRRLGQFEGLERLK